MSTESLEVRLRWRETGHRINRFVFMPILKTYPS